MIALVLALTIFFILCVLYQLLFANEKAVAFSDYLGSATKAIAALIPTIASIRGLTDKRQARHRTRLRTVPSLASGLYGGLIAGAASGLVISFIYYLGARDVGLQRVAYGFLYASAAGTILGLLIQAGVLSFSSARGRSSNDFIFNEVTGGTLGGILGGIVAGALGGVIFGLMNGPTINEALLVLASAISALFVAAGILLYGYTGRLQRVLPSLITAAVALLLVACIAAIVLTMLDVSDRFFRSSSPLDLLTGGAIFGVAVGMALGLSV